MKILHTVKYYDPSLGGMETVAKNIVEGVSGLDASTKFTVYSNHHYSSVHRQTSQKSGNLIIKERTPFLYKSQPLNLIYPHLKQLILDNDIIHHHYPFPNLELSLVKNLEILKGKKLIITWHANIKNSRWSFIEKMYDPLIRKLLRQAAHVVVTSPQLYENSTVLKSYENKIEVIPLSFDPHHNETDDVTPRTILLDNPPKILFVGKLRTYKGVGFLIDAVRNLKNELIIVGDGEEEANLINQVKSYGLEDRVKFFKKVSDQQLRNFYQQADLFVLPSINEAEAFGVVQLEAMAYGLPIINTNLNSGVTFASPNNVSGLTVAPKDSMALENAITKILSDKVLYEQLSANGMERAKLFTRDKLSQSYLNLYNS